MKVYKFNVKILDTWWTLLKNLSDDLKLELASRLIDSIKKDSPKPPPVNNGWESLFGAWKNDGTSAEELIDFVRSSRLSNRKIESFD